jgi:putative ABC transport system permease protein
MWRHYLSTTARGFARHRLYSAINIVGLAVGLTCIIFVVLFVRDELSSVFTAEQRTKEIGIRKISGARTADIVRLMLWPISVPVPVPVLVANVIAWPVAYAYPRNWLDSYAYRVPLSPFYFLAGAMVALLVAWATVCGNTLRLARANPVHALRYE